MIETAISVVSSKALLTLFGACDQHLRRVRDALGVRISARDGRIYIEGDQQAVASATEVLEQDGKALVQIGYAHSFTHYRQPRVVNGKRIGDAPGRFGYILREKYGDRVFQVCMHQWHLRPEAFSERAPEQEALRHVLGGVLEKAFEAYGKRPVGSISSSICARSPDFSKILSVERRS